MSLCSISLGLSKQLSYVNKKSIQLQYVYTLNRIICVYVYNRTIELYVVLLNKTIELQYCLTGPLSYIMCKTGSLIYYYIYFSLQRPPHNFYSSQVQTRYAHVQLKNSYITRVGQVINPPGIRQITKFPLLHGLPQGGNRSKLALSSITKQTWQKIRTLIQGAHEKIDKRSY